MLPLENEGSGLTGNMRTLMSHTREEKTVDDEFEFEDKRFDGLTFIIEFYLIGV